jgi:hypothetical protein
MMLVDAPISTCIVDVARRSDDSVGVFGGVFGGIVGLRRDISGGMINTEDFDVRDGR